MTRYDRYGDPIEDAPNTTHDYRCNDGWLGDDEHDHSIPCLQCRPHLKGKLPMTTPSLRAWESGGAGETGDDCPACGSPMSAALVAAGEKTHATCEAAA